MTLDKNEICSVKKLKQPENVHRVAFAICTVMISLCLWNICKLIIHEGHTKETAMIFVAFNFVVMSFYVLALLGNWYEKSEYYLPCMYYLVIYFITLFFLTVYHLFYSMKSAVWVLRAQLEETKKMLYGESVQNFHIFIYFFALSLLYSVFICVIGKSGHIFEQEAKKRAKQTMKLGKTEIFFVGKKKDGSV